MSKDLEELLIFARVEIGSIPQDVITSAVQETLQGVQREIDVLDNYSESHTQVGLEIIRGNLADAKDKIQRKLNQTKSQSVLEKLAVAKHYITRLSIEVDHQCES